MIYAIFTTYDGTSFLDGLIEGRDAGEDFRAGFCYTINPKGFLKIERSSWVPTEDIERTNTIKVTGVAY